MEKANINTVYELVQLVSNKTSGGGVIRPIDFNRVINQVNQELFKYFYGSPEQYQPGRPVPRVAYGMTQKINDALAPFQTLPVTIAVGQDGTVLLPDDLVHIDTLLSTYYDSNGLPVKVAVKLKTHQKMGFVFASKLLPATQKHPIAVRIGNRLQVYPKISAIEISYLRLPSPVEWAFTLSNGRPLYDAARSKHLEWGRIHEGELASRCLSYLGIKMKASDVLQFAENKINQGI